jgi:hypothetical protein
LGNGWPIETSMDGIAEAQARIQEIQDQFAMQPAAGFGDAPGGVLGTPPSAADDATFAQTLAKALSASPSSATMPANNDSLNRAGVNSVQWAKDFLTQLGMPVTPDNVRAITAWEQAEGTRAQFNPLATTQAGYSGESRFNSVGVKNYASYADGISANIKAITNGLYGNILAALRTGNNAMAVAQAVANSPWGTGQGVMRVLQSQ